MIFSSIDFYNSIANIVSSFHIPPTIMCRRAEEDELACFDSSRQIVFYEDVVEVGLRFSIPGPICQIQGHLSLTLRRLTLNV